MNNKVTHLFMFMAGAVIASAVTWKIAKDKYEQIAQEEINSYKEHHRKKNENTGLAPKVVVTKTEPEVYAQKIAESGYGGAFENHEKGEPSTMNVPYTISYEEFGEKDYETIGMTYYADKVLVEDITDEVVEDIDETIGYDSLLHFGEYEEDMLYVRNDDLRTDYEISLSSRSYYSDRQSGQ